MMATHDHATGTHHHFEVRDPAPKIDNDFQYRIILDCKDEAHQANLLEMFDAMDLPARPLIT